MKITDYIIAEDIRFETGNKISVMGFYSEEIRLNLPDDTQWPIPYRFGIYIRLKTTESDAIPNRFLLKVDRNNDNIVEVNGNIDLKELTHTLTFPLVLSPFPLPGYGPIQFSFEIYRNEDLLLSETQEIVIIKEDSEKSKLCS